MLALFSCTDRLILTDKQKNDFFNALLLQAKKLLSLWIHYDRFRKEEEKLKASAPVFDSAIHPGPQLITYSQELFMEFDEYLVQYKSSLDYLAKLPGSLLGRDKWNPRSFGEKGERIVRMLKSALPKEKKKQATDFEEFIFEKHKVDIQMIVDVRDKINHLVDGGISFKNFAVYGLRENGVVTYKCPMWSHDQCVSEFMRVAFYNHLKFCEDFIVFFLGLYLQPGFGFFHAPL
jgi:hypothetical protein